MQIVVQSVKIYKIRKEIKKPEKIKHNFYWILKTLKTLKNLENGIRTLKTLNLNNKFREFRERFL